MTDLLSRIRRFLRELKRRNVYRVAVAYLAVAFVGPQAARLLVPPTTLPGWADDLLIYLAVFGFPIALVLAWAFEMTADGMRRTPDAEVGAGEGQGARGRVRAGYRVLVGLGLLAAAAAGGWYLTGGGGTTPDVSEGTVAVLPFQVSGSGADTWHDGMVSLLAPGLDGAAGLRAIPDRTVLAAWQEHGLEDRGGSTGDALSVARDVGAEYAVVGTAAGLGSGLQLTAGVYRTRSGNRIGQIELRGSPDNVMALADTLTRQVLGMMLEKSDAAIPSVDLASLTTRSLPALKSYLTGERHLRAGEYGEAREDFEAAVDMDSTFALAWSRLQTARFITDARGVSQASERASELSDQLPERERRRLRAVSLWVPDRRPQAARDSLRRLREDYPDDPMVWSSLGESLYHGNVPGGWPDAEEAKERAIDLDPGNPPPYNHFIDLAFSLHRDSALAVERIAQHPAEDFRTMFRVALRMVFGSGEGREAAFARLDSLPVSTLWQLTNALNHPTDGDLQARALRRLKERDGILRGRYVLRQLMNSVEHGRVRRAVVQIRNAPHALDRSGSSGCLLAWSESLGISVPDSVVRARIDPARLDGEPPVSLLGCRGIYLVEHDRTEDLPGLLDRIRTRGAEEDLPEPRIRATVNEVRGYRAWKEGRLARAAELWGDAQQSERAGAIWRGDLYRKRGELRKAEAWYIAAWSHPVAHERLGQLYEEIGEAENAAAAYRRFVESWKNADEVLQDRVEAALKRLETLTESEAQADG